MVGVVDDVDVAFQTGGSFSVWPYVLAYGACTITICMAIGGFIWMGGKIRTHVAHDIRRDGFENLQRLSFSFYDYRPVGWLMARMTSDCERLSNILAWGFLDLVWGTTMMIGIAAAMGVVLGVRDDPASDRAGFLAQLNRVCDHLATARPTMPRPRLRFSCKHDNFIVGSPDLKMESGTNRSNRSFYGTAGLA